MFFKINVCLMPKFVLTINIKPSRPGFFMRKRLLHFTCNSLSFSSYFSGWNLTS